jgi:TolB-like protein
MNDHSDPPPPITEGKPGGDGTEQKPGGDGTPSRRQRVVEHTVRYTKRVRGLIIAVAGVGAVLSGLVGLWQTYKTVVSELISKPAATSPTKEVERPRLSVAVLPLISLGETGQNDYFADGLTEDILSALGRFSDLTVRSRSAAFAYKGKSVSPEQLGRELAVRYVVDGSVRRSPDKIKVAIRLTDTGNGKLVWSENYDAEPKDIFAVQDDITRRVAGTLMVKLSSTELARTTTKPPSSLEAYDLVLRGRDLLTRLSRSNNNQARALFERALETDPRYVAAYVGLGFVNLTAVVQGWTADPMAALKRAEDLGLRAAEIDPASSGAHALLGQLYLRMYQIDRALDEFKRAIALNSSDPDNYAGLGNALLWNGDIPGAIKAVETATQFRPSLSSGEFLALGAAYLLADRSSDAVRILERGAARHESMQIYGLLAAAYAEAGQTDAAERQAELVRQKFPQFMASPYGTQLRDPEHRAKIELALKKAGL